MEELLLKLEDVGVDCALFGPNGCELPIEPFEVKNTFSWTMPANFEEMKEFEYVKDLLGGVKRTLDIRMRILNEDEDELACADAVATVDFE